MKTCTKCQATKSFDDFYKRSCAPDGHEAWCKVCRLNHNRAWLIKNKDRHGELTRLWYEHNKDQHLVNSKVWYAANRYRKLATTTVREQRCKQATPVWVDKEEVVAMYAEAQRKTLETGIQHDVDHIIPLQGKLVSGLHVQHNLQVITSAENKRKAAKYTLT
jgi:siroheme synthase (precorrin-2 oxidase/ferrochelatase)